MSNRWQSHNIGYEATDKLLAELPPGLEREVLTILAKCVGRDKALVKGGILYHVRKKHTLIKTTERQIRLVVNKLRKSGVMICSTGGIDGGYWIAKDRQELEEFLDHEIRTRINDLREQELALLEAAAKEWGKPYQPSLF